MESIFSIGSANTLTCKAASTNNNNEVQAAAPAGGFKDMVLGSVDFGISRLGRVLRGRSSSYIIPMVREQLAQSLSAATIGSMTIEEKGGLEATFGRSDDSGPHVRLTVLSEQFWVRLLLVQDLGFAEAYMAGEVAVSSLVDFIRFYIYNRAVLDASSSSPIVSSLMYLASTRFGNSVLNTATNISAHYDLGNEMFE
ncbi:hypothetical protein GGI22_004765, partial [Coemansia erecta]